MTRSEEGAFCYGLGCGVILALVTLTGTLAILVQRDTPAAHVDDSTQFNQYVCMHNGVTLRAVCN